MPLSAYTRSQVERQKVELVPELTELHLTEVTLNRIESAIQNWLCSWTD